jgi:uncharacterized protein YlaI
MIENKIKIARYDYMCEKCEKTIEKGSKYRYISGAFGVYSRFHLECE